MSTEESNTVNDALKGLLEFHGVIRAGEVLVIESERRLPAEAVHRLREDFDLIFQKFGVGVILLDGGLRVAGKRAS